MLIENVTFICYYNLIQIVKITKVKKITRFDYIKSFSAVKNK